MYSGEIPHIGRRYPPNYSIRDFPFIPKTKEVVSSKCPSRYRSICNVTEIHQDTRKIRVPKKRGKASKRVFEGTVLLL